MVSLAALFPLDLAHTDALDRFVSTCLSDAGVWSSPRVSDGIACIDRVLEHGPERLRLAGRIYSIDQAQHPFWLEIYREPSGTSATWVLYFDLAEVSSRRARNAVVTYERADDAPWRVVLAGEAALAQGVLEVVPGSVRALVRDDLV